MNKAGINVSALSRIKTSQKSWANARDIAVDQNGYTTCLEKNILCTLSDATRNEFQKGDGNELGTKMRALHSSSALAVNFFEYWRNIQSDATFASVLSLPSTEYSIHFEQKYKTGLKGNAPNLDIVMRTAKGSIAIESKFTEPYSKARHDLVRFKEKYLEGKALWQNLNLPKCQQLASDISERKRKFAMLDAMQLLKHILGLRRSEEKPRLLYLWYATPCSESHDHAKEIEEFSREVDESVGFSSMTYQELYSRLARHSSPAHQDYLKKLGDRYFDGNA